MAQGKGARRRAKERRAQEKRARKAIQKAQYQQWALDGRNAKSTRFRRKKGTKLKIRDASCKNVGDITTYEGADKEAFIANIIRLGHQYKGRYKGLFVQLRRVHVEGHLALNLGTPLSYLLPKHMLRDHQGNRLFAR